MKKLAALLLTVAAALTLMVSGGVTGAGATGGGGNPPYPFAPNLPTVAAIPNPVAPNKSFRAQASWYCPKVKVVFTLLSGNTVLQTKNVTANTGGSASATFSGVAAGTYTVRAAQTKPSSGSLARTCKVDITTNTTLLVEVDVTPPGPAQNFDAVALTSSSIKLTWTAATGGPSTYVLSRSASNSGPWSLIGTVSATSALTFTNTGLSPSTTYYYQIVAKDAAGNESTPVVDSATTPAATGITVNGYATVAGGRRMAVLTWTGNTGRVDVYRLSSGSLKTVKRSYASQQYTDVVPSGTYTAVYYVCPTGVKPPSARCGSVSLAW